MRIVLPCLTELCDIFGIGGGSAVLILGEAHRPCLKARDSAHFGELVHCGNPLVREVEGVVYIVICGIEQSVSLRGVDLIPVLQRRGGAGVGGDGLFADLHEFIYRPVIAGLLDVQRFEHIQVHRDAHGVHLAGQRIELAAVDIGIGHAAGHILRLGIGKEVIVKRHDEAAGDFGRKIVPVQPHQVGHSVGRSLLGQIFVEGAAGGAGEGFLHDFDVWILCAEGFKHGLDFRNLPLGIGDGHRALELIDVLVRRRFGRFFGAAGRDRRVARAACQHTDKEKHGKEQGHNRTHFLHFITSIILLYHQPFSHSREEQLSRMFFLRNCKAVNFKVPARTVLRRAAGGSRNASRANAHGSAWL